MLTPFQRVMQVLLIVAFFAFLFFILGGVRNFGK